MLSKKSLIKIFIILILFSPVFLGAMNINHIITLKKEGSGNLNLSYWAKSSDIKSGNSIIGNFPFTQDKIQELFTAQGLTVKGITIAKDAKDNTFDRVTLTIFFLNIESLNILKPFANFNVSLVTSEKGNVITYKIEPDFEKQNSIENLFVILKPESEILSSNGKIEGKNVSWFRSGKFLKDNKGFAFTATLKSEEKTASGTNSGEGKSCGLFGMELPILMLSGLVFSYKFKRKGKN